ncbi:MAG TPA: lytic murein transglycosylase [Nocardioidaceae bacterium]|nr:lytic murein transglycosylase [Nocardioidaceae bacterium]
MKRSSIDASTIRKATALLPLALLSAGWSVALAVSSAGASSESPSLAVPATEAIQAPASVSPSGVLRRAVQPSRSLRTVQTSTSQVIPAAALAAYQRAAQVMSTADPRCHVSWPLIAALGRVESDHGRHGGSVLTAEGVASPPIIGARLDGTHGTARIADTDAGQVDQDANFDRAVGPLQFIPSTWSVVGVDGDGDQKRDPQDIDDAALAAAVYLCSGKDDLATDAGVDSAVFRYNHSKAYVALVKSIAAAYSSGQYAAVPTSSYAPVVFSNTKADTIRALHTAAAQSHQPAVVKPGTTGSKPAPSAQPSAPATPPKGDDNEPEKDAVEQVLAEAPKAIQHTVDELLVNLSTLVGGLLPIQP